MRFTRVFVGSFLLLLTATFASAEELMPADEALIHRLVSINDIDTSCHEVEVLSNRLNADAVKPSQLRLQALTDKEPLGLFTVMASIEGDDGAVSRGQVRFRVRRYARVVVAAEKILRHDLLTADRLAMERLEVTNLIERPLRDFDELAGMRAKRNLRMGTILTAAAVEPFPDVESGHRVTVIYDDGRCRITTAGVALQSGVTGNYVKVKNESSGKIIVAKVVDESTVAIDP